MKLKLQRFHSSDDFTIGKLFINDVFECYTIEDENREQKVMHETRIPAGTYVITLRTFGGHHEKYVKKFDFHKGMLWLQDVPKFKDILIHIGNTDNDSSGCVIVGKTADLIKGYVGQSTIAYKEMYLKVISAFERDEKVFIEIIDEI